MSQKLHLHFHPEQTSVSCRNQRSKRNLRNVIHCCNSYYPVFFDVGNHLVVDLTSFVLSLKKKVKVATWFLYPLQPHISLYILHSVLFTLRNKNSSLIVDRFHYSHDLHAWIWGGLSYGQWVKCSLWCLELLLLQFNNRLVQKLHRRKRLLTNYYLQRRIKMNTRGLLDGSNFIWSLTFSWACSVRRGGWRDLRGITRFSAFFLGQRRGDQSLPVMYEKRRGGL